MINNYRNKSQRGIITAVVALLVAGLIVSKPARAVSGNAGDANNSDAGTSVESAFANYVQQWISEAENPAVLRRLTAQARNNAIRHYGDLLKQLNLPPEQLESLIQLLTSKRQVNLDVIVAMLKQGVFQPGEAPSNYYGEFSTEVHASQAELESQIRSLLGPGNYSLYVQFDLSEAQSNVVNFLQANLGPTGNTLTPNQVARLEQVMQGERATHVTPQLIHDAASFLTPPQIQALRDLRAIGDENSRKRNQPLQPLPTTPRPPQSN